MTTINSKITNDLFWNKYKHVIKHEMLPYQWDVLNDKIDICIQKERDDDSIPSEKSHAIENFKIAAKLKEGHHYGMVFQDSDVYKWLEAVAYSLQNESDPELEKLADGVVDLIAKAQESDGYLNTYFTIDAPKRKYKRLAQSHELYCAGHYIEAAVAYYTATNNQKALDVACKLADHIAQHFGNEEGKIKGVDGHQEIELALVKLYRITKNKAYLDLSHFFIYERGQNPNFFAEQAKNDITDKMIIDCMRHLEPNLKYFQIHQPILEQKEAVGHAVRQTYMCTGMADLAYETQDKKLLQTCEKLWSNIVHKKMYITGGIGSTVNGEAFTSDYDLPNNTMYCETCASIALVFFAYNMLKNKANSEYADIIEKALYNGILSGMSTDGKHFFYVNPLEVVPENIKNDPQKSHVKIARPEWFGCACCPPNLARLINSLDNYIYLNQKETTYVNLFINSQNEIKDKLGHFTIQQKTTAPWQGKSTFTMNVDKSQKRTVAIRVPYWAKNYQFTLNNKEISPELKNGYAYFSKEWITGDVIEFDIKIDVQKYYSHPFVRNNVDRVAVQRGPFIYCLEGNDNEHYPLHLLKLNKESHFTIKQDNHLFEGAITIQASGVKEMVNPDEQVQLYSLDNPVQTQTTKLNFIPYFLWANREENEMLVWIRQQ